MKLFRFGLGSSSKLEPRQQERLQALRRLQPLSDCRLADGRFVVVDLETTGLNLRRDQVISIGAVVIENSAIDFSQMFERTLYRERIKISASILIHGIAPSELATGSDPVEALLDFMEFVGESPLLAFHAGFDQRMLLRALRESLAYRMPHAFFDVAEIAPLLRPEANLRNAGLDDWVGYFALHVLQRHNASADAMATAELGLILLKLAHRQGIETLAQLEQRLNGWRRTQQPQHSL
ncbi:PolC-type DNA polymerase III [Azomonas macrocytogenes]|uniref:DNA polymerase-3 subunit epsilon n=1 Tax=Azomonas macrocytogenes TaxID=69962 RepID=A0A839T2L3_AZOMA|nr:3'-5' exonuclease [Azomonas macrocytogenes]MBB3102726.1 DNA polymerase-3 subunit epsilon [Azomonas macrocytogenes]